MNAQGVTHDRLALWDRKRALGKRATYEILADRIGKSKPAIYYVLRNRPSPIPIDRPALLQKIAEALTAIEAEKAEEEATSASDNA